MNILITGSSGFVASSLISSLCTSNHDILCLSRDIARVSERFKDNKNINFIKIDITKESLLELDFKPEIVINLAAAQPSGNSTDWSTFYEGNVEVVRKLLELSFSEGVKKFLHISTTSIYSSPSRKPYDENSVPNPNNLYSLSKFMGDSLLKVMSVNSKNDTESVVLRFPSIFGSQHSGGLVYTYYTLAKENKEIEIYNEGKTMRNLLFIDHAVEAILLFINGKSSDKKYNEFIVGSSNSLSSMGIASYIKQKIRSSSKLIPVSKSSQIIDDVYLDGSKLETTHNFRLHSIEEGLNEFLKFSS